MMGYISEEVRIIDENIFYFVEDKLLLKLKREDLLLIINFSKIFFKHV